MVKDPRRVNDLEPEVLVIQVPYKKGLGGERKGLDFYVGS